MQLELFHHNPNIQEVTVGHLLAMTSGIDDWSVGMIQDWMYLYGRDDDLDVPLHAADAGLALVARAALADPLGVDSGDEGIQRHLGGLH